MAQLNGLNLNAEGDKWYSGINIGDILKIAATVVAGIAALKLAVGVKNLITGLRGQRGNSAMNPLFVSPVGGGMGGGGGNK